MTQFPDAERNCWFAANRTPLVEGYVSETLDGRQAAPLMGDYTEPDVGTLRIRSLPNLWLHACCDHAVGNKRRALLPDVVPGVRGVSLDAGFSSVLKSTRLWATQAKDRVKLTEQ